MWIKLYLKNDLFKFSLTLKGKIFKRQPVPNIIDKIKYVPYFKRPSMNFKGSKSIENQIN